MEDGCLNAKSVCANVSQNSVTLEKALVKDKSFYATPGRLMYIILLSLVLGSMELVWVSCCAS
jgi:hypothetical protein